MTDKLLDLTPSSTHILKGGGKERVWVEVAVTAPELERKQKRQPMDIVIVLDRSGSMGADRFQGSPFGLPAPVRPWRQPQPVPYWNQNVNYAGDGLSNRNNVAVAGGSTAPSWIPGGWPRPSAPFTPPCTPPAPAPYVQPYVSFVQPLPVRSKLEHAKQAAIHVLEQLGPDDRCAVIVYDSTVDTIHRLSANHDAAVEKVDRVTSGGSTALAPALDRALELLERRAGEEGRSRHVFLLSDGQANVGERRPEVIADRAAKAAAKGVRVATFGLGSDYNEELMEAVAIAGGGGYYFLETGDDAPDAFGKELELAFQVSVRDVELDVKPATGVEITRILGLDANEFPVQVGDIPARATRTVMVELELATGKTGERPLVAASVRFKRGKQRRWLSEQAEAVVRVTTSAKLVQEGVSPRVLGKVAELEAAIAQAQAARFADQGDYASAQNVLSSSYAALNATVSAAPQLASMLRSKTGELERDIAAVSDASSYGSMESKRMKFASYTTRSSR